MIDRLWRGWKTEPSRQSPPVELQAASSAHTEFVVCDCTIELLFKLWKSYGQIDTWRSTLPWQALCELYAKLIAVVIQHWLLIFGCWHEPWRSLIKAAAVVRALALDLLEVLSGTRRLPLVVRKERAMMQSGCRVNRRAAEPCLAQLLLEGLDWVLT